MRSTGSLGRQTQHAVKSWRYTNAIGHSAASQGKNSVKRPEATAHTPRTLRLRQQHNYSTSSSLSNTPKNVDDVTSGQSQSSSSTSSNFAREPHKEYFQSPGQYPKSDLTPYVRDSSQTSSSTTRAPSFNPPPPAYLQRHPRTQETQETQGQNYNGNGSYMQGQQRTQQQQSSQSYNPNSFMRRFLRSSSLIAFFGLFGVGAGTGLITFEYLSPMFAEGSEEEAELVEEILDTLENSALIDGLREHGWREIDLSASPTASLAGNNTSNRIRTHAASSDLTAAGLSSASGSSEHGQSNNILGLDSEGRAAGIGMGRNMLHQVLTGSKGLLGMKMFHHPSQDYSVMVFFAGFGIEGWPDVMHGGVVTSLLEEAVTKHVDWYHRGQIDRVIDVGVKIDFKKPVHPGEIYAILVPPAAIETIREQSLGFSNGMNSGMNRLKLVGLFMQLEGAPRVSSGTMTNGGTAVEHKIEVPGRGNSGPDVHAVAEVTLKVVARGGNNNSDFLESIAKNNAQYGGSRNQSQIQSDED